MVTSQTQLWQSQKSQSRLKLEGENGLRIVQIAGSEPQQMAEAAMACEDAGAHVVDINMGCPAKKVCNRAAGSALLKDEGLVQDILCAVVSSCHVPVTLKIRTGWDETSKNACRVARIAQDVGIRLLCVHGRTRACRFTGTADYQTIAQVVKETDLPVVANGDITSPIDAQNVLEQTGAVAVMIGRGAQGNPWLFEQINAFLTSGQEVRQPHLAEVAQILHKQLTAMYNFYGQEQGVRIARKHFAWYMDKHLPTQEAAKLARQQFNLFHSPKEQLKLVSRLFNEHLPLEEEAA
jgi:tRNA-dihydrouridine synthase B